MTDNLENIEDVNEIEDVNDNIDGSESIDEESPETRAKRMGWKPEEEFQGKGEWVDAETFLKKTEEETPHLKHSLIAMERNYKRLEKTMEAIKNHQDRQLKITEEEAYNRAKDDLERSLKNAVEDGDVEAAQKIFSAGQDLRKVQEKQPVINNNETVDNWKENNKWFDEDQELKGFAISYEDSLAKQGIELSKRLDMTTEYVKRAFPYKFNKKPPVMNQSSNNVRADRKPKYGTYEALTKDAKVECDRMVKGFKDKDKDEAMRMFLKYASSDMFIQ